MIGAVFAMISALFCVMVVLVGSAAAGREIDDELGRIRRGERPADDEVQHQWDEVTAQARSRWQTLRERNEERRTQTPRTKENVMPSDSELTYGQSADWQPERPRLRVFPLVISWLAMGIALMVAAGVLPGVGIDSFWGALVVAAIVAALNAIIPPVLAALRLPLTLVLGFLLVLLADAAILRLAADLTNGVLTVDSFGWALLAALVVAAVSVVLAVVLGSDDTYSLRIAKRIARRQGIIASTDVPGIVFLEIDGLALPVLRRAMRDGNAPTMARWLADDTHRLAEWETDLSSQTGASQAGILLGSNDDIPAFRWVEKETATLMACSAPPDCAEIERRHATGSRPAGRWRRQPRKPSLRRGGGRDPHGQPDGGGEAVQSGLSGIPRQRRQRDAHPRAVPVGGDPRVDRGASRHPP